MQVIVLMLQQKGVQTHNLLELVRSNAWTVDDGPVVDTSEIIVILNIWPHLEAGKGQEKWGSGADGCGADGSGADRQARFPALGAGVRGRERFREEEAGVFSADGAGRAGVAGEAEGQ